MYKRVNVKHQRMSISLSPDLAEYVRERAKKSQMSQSAVIALAIYWMRHRERQSEIIQSLIEDARDSEDDAREKRNGIQE